MFGDGIANSGLKTSHVWQGPATKKTLNMKKNALFALFAALCLLMTATTGCNKDDDSGNDQTAQVTGTYKGTYKEGAVGSTVTVNDVETTITRETDAKVKVNIKVFPGFAGVVFTADMTDGTNFTVPQFKLNDDDLKGTGRLESGTTLKIDLDKVNEAGAKVTFEGTKQ